MEAIALGGLLLLGLTQKQNNSTQIKKPTNKTQNKTSNKITDFTGIDNIKDIEHLKLQQSEYPLIDNVLEAVPNSSHIETKDSSPKETNLGIDSMFQPLSIKNTDVASFNQAPITGNIEDPRLKREIDYMEGFSDFTDTVMHYNVTDKMQHNNMIPSTSRRDMPLMNYDNFNRRLDLQTGSSRDWVPKQEVEKMFAPTKHGRKIIDGQPVLNGELGSRFITSFKNNNGNLPFQNKVKVRPGLDGEIQEGRHSTYRVLPRNIDEIRGENNQRITYEQPTIEAARKGRMPQKMGEFHSKKSIFNERKEDVKGKATVQHAVPRGIFSASSSGNRANSNQYNGPAVRKSKTVVKAEAEPTGRQSFFNDYVRNPIDTNKGRNVNTNSVQLYETNRDSTSHNITGHANKSTKGYSNLTDEAKATIKQTTLYSRDGNMKPTDHSTYSNLTDDAKATIKQTTLYSRDGNMKPTDHSTYSNLMDDAKATIKQTTLYSRDGNMKPNDHTSYSNLMDDAKATIKQTTLYSRDGNINPNDHTSYSTLQDDARNTIKQTTLYSREGNMDPNGFTSYSNLQDEARPTIKHSTLFHVPEKSLSRPGARVDKQIIMDKARNTIKQTTLLEGHVPALASVEPKARVYDDALNMYHDDCKETSLQSRPNPGGQHQFRAEYDNDSDTRNRLFVNSAREPSISRPLDYQTPNPEISFSTRYRDSSVINNYHITDDFTNTLKDNPLVNDLRHQKNTNYTL